MRLNFRIEVALALLSREGMTARGAAAGLRSCVYQPHFVSFSHSKGSLLGIDVFLVT